MQVGPGTKDYGALSLAVQYYAKPQIIANVPPNCFMPRPKVGSAVIQLVRYEEPPVLVTNEKLMFRLIVLLLTSEENTGKWIEEFSGTGLFQRGNRKNYE